MTRTTDSQAEVSTEVTVHFNLGTFEGFNRRSQSAVDRTLNAQEVIVWNHDQLGETEFRPAGDKAEVALIFEGRKTVTGSELSALHRLLSELGGDSTENFLRIHFAVNRCGAALEGLSAQAVQDQRLHMFVSDESIYDLRKDAACALFELYHPNEYAVWDSGRCEALIFETDLFLDSPCFCVEDVTLGERVAVLVALQ